MPAWLAEDVLGLHALAWNHGSNSSHCRSGLLSCPSCPWSPRLWPQHHVCPAPLLWKLPLWCSCCMLPHQTTHNPHMHSSGKCSNSWCCFCAIHSWQPLFQHAQVLWRRPRLVVSQGIAYEIVLLHHAPLVSTSSTAALFPSSSLPACQRSKRKDKHEMLGILTAGLFMAAAGLFMAATHHPELRTLLTFRVANWDVALRIEKIRPRCELRPKRVVKWTTSPFHRTLSRKAAWDPSTWQLKRRVRRRSH